MSLVLSLAASARRRSEKFLASIPTHSLVACQTLLLVGATLVAISVDLFAEDRYSKALVDAATKARNSAVGVNTQNVNIGEFSPPIFSRFNVTTEASSAEKAIPDAEKRDLGQNSATEATFPLRNMQALGQMADSADLQKYYHALLRRRIPVGQMTMMMVENGAATGFMGALSGLSSIYDNTIQSHNLQLAQLQAFDHSGLAVKQYERSLAEQMQVEGHKDAYVHAMWATNADVLDLDSKTEIKDSPTAIKYTYPLALSDTRGAIIDPKINPGSIQPEVVEAPKKLLSAIVFDDVISKASASNDLTGKQHPNDSSKIQAFKTEFVELFGDVEFEVENRNGVHLRNSRYIEPARVDGRKAIDALDRSYLESVWTNMQTVLREYCKYKAQDANYEIDIYEKKRPASVLEDRKTERDNASAPDIALTVPFVDQIFKLMVPGKSLEQVDCEEVFDPSLDRMPSIDDDSTSSSSISATPAPTVAGRGTTFDDCKAEPKSCLRNKVIYTAARLIARSRTLHHYLFAYQQVAEFVREPLYQKQVGDLVDHALEGVNIETEIEDNRERWIGFSNFLAKLAQGSATGSSLSTMISSGGSNQ
jgi:hypothetical protein